MINLELYKGIAGSPITYLLNEVSSGQTTITIADDSALPDAPNICTIGFGENIETIKYTGKSGGVLTGVTRGIEGTPQSWPIGTEVARFFTAYDHNSMIDEFSSHLAEETSDDVHGLLSGGHIIEESGSNDDGEYIRFADGTQICTGRSRANQNIGIQGDRHQHDYPRAFIKPPSVSFSLIGDGAFAVSGEFKGTVCSGNTTTWAIRDGSESSVVVDADVSFSAIGRWK